MSQFQSDKPDFIIAGAMKCGTTWLHYALNALPQISIPDGEIHLTDVQDFIVHSDFFQCKGDTIRSPDISDTSWAAWHRETKENNPEDIIGWDSTTLFHSYLNLDRIAAEYSNTKVIILLRDPASRSYSHYWHLVKTGRCSKSFEKAMLHGSKELVYRSIYRDQARKIKEAFQERALFVSYETLFSSPEEEFSRILHHLGIEGDYSEQLTASLNTKFNSGKFPNFTPGWLLASKLLSGLEKRYYAHELSNRQSFSTLAGLASYRFKQCVMVLGGVGFSRKRRTRIKPETKAFLNDYFIEANYDLDKITGLDVSNLWFT